MSDPPRLIGDGNDFERSLLGAWDTRQPDDAARSRTLTAVGVGVVALGAGTAAAASGSIAPKAMLVSSALLKWIGIGVGVVAALGAVGYATYSRRASPTDLAAGSPPALAAPVVREVKPNAVSPFEQPKAVATTAEDPSFEPAPAPLRATTLKPPPAPVVVPSTLDDEIYAIDQARRALTAGNASGALQLVDAYDARYPRGALGQESTEIRIEGLFRTGNRPLAIKLASRFLAAHPESPYAREIHALTAAVPAP